MKLLRSILFSTALIFTSFIDAQDLPLSKSSSQRVSPHHLYFGADLLSLHTNIENWGEKITGETTLKGARIGYDFVKPNAFYFGTHFLITLNKPSFNFESKYPTYSISEHSSFYKERFTLQNGELRFGYTFAGNENTSSLFLGIGRYAFHFPYKKDFYMMENTSFSNFLSYATGGVRISYSFSPSLSLGFNAKLFWILCSLESFFSYEDGYSETCLAPIIKKVMHRKSLFNKERTWGGEVSFPLTWHFGLKRKWGIQFEPYYVKLNTPRSELSSQGILKGYGVRFLLELLF